MEDTDLFPGSLAVLLVWASTLKEQNRGGNYSLETSRSQTTGHCLLCNKFPKHCFLFLNTGILLDLKGRGSVFWFFLNHRTTTNFMFCNSIIFMVYMCVLHHSGILYHGHSPFHFFLFINKTKILCQVLILHQATLQVGYKIQVLSYVQGQN